MERRTLQIGMLKLLVHTVGRLSNGVRIAHRHGFTSGKMLDYVYRNEPSGKGPLGRFLDRAYLSHEGWRAVRIRTQHLQELLAGAIRQALQERGEVLLLDIAAGPARYLQDALLKFPQTRIEAVCWDLADRWLEEGQRSAADRGLRNILYDHGDAMNALDYRRLARRPDIVVASGFYDWMEEDAAIQESLRLVHDALGEGGCFVFTIQTGHVDLRMVNAVFHRFDGGPLRMTTRPAAVVHGWARRIGFRIERIRSDEWRYHAVTLARKR